MTTSDTASSQGPKQCELVLMSAISRVVAIRYRCPVARHNRLPLLVLAIQDERMLQCPVKSAGVIQW